MVSVEKGPDNISGASIVLALDHGAPRHMNHDAAPPLTSYIVWNATLTCIFYSFFYPSLLDSFLPYHHLKTPLSVNSLSSSSQYDFKLAWGHPLAKLSRSS